MTKAFLKGCAPTGSRTPVSALRGPRPGPLDDGGNAGHSTIVARERQRNTLKQLRLLGE